jgi:chromosome segregation ATPase
MKIPVVFSVLLFLLTACSNQNDTLEQENLTLKTEISKKNQGLLAFDEYVQSLQVRLSQLKQNHRITDAKLLKNNEKDVSYTLLQDIRLIDNWMLAIEKQVADGKYAIAEANHLTSLKQEELNLALKKLSLKQDQLLATQSDIVKLAKMLEEFDNQLCEQDELLMKLDKQMNNVYFAFGNNDELINSGVANKKKGLFKKQKSVELKTDFDTTYFTQVDKRQLKEIPVKSEEALLLSSHPEGSYEWIGEDSIETLKILDVELFWRNTSYLAMAVK